MIDGFVSLDVTEAWFPARFTVSPNGMAEPRLDDAAMGQLLMALVAVNPDQRMFLKHDMVTLVDPMWEGGPETVRRDADGMWDFSQLNWSWYHTTDVAETA
jgi:hypothetical protein